MRHIIYGLIVGVLLVAAAGSVGAQDATATPLALAPQVPATIYQEQAHLIPEQFGGTLQQISYQYDICPELLFEANRDVLPEGFEALQASSETIRTELIFKDFRTPESLRLTIPAHDPCYTIISMPAAANAQQIEKDYNVCEEELVGWSTGYYRENYNFYLRKDAPPCINEQGQRLIYHQIGERWFTDGYSELPWIDGPEDFTSLGYCVADIQAANPYLHLPQRTLDADSSYYFYISEYRTQYPAGTRFFIPPNVHHCNFVSVREHGLYETSQKYNICMETLLEVSNLTMYHENTSFFLSIPQERLPCYDEMGQRLNTAPESVYKPQIGETFLEIARKHDICMDALWDANPLMDHWDGLSYRLPDVMFIPEDHPCKFSRSITSRSNMTLLGLATMTNVCRNRIYDDNAQLRSLGVKEGSGFYRFDERLQAGKMITFRDDRPPCYRLTSQEHIDQIFYVCYSVPVTPENDFTGHVPVISFSTSLDLPYCYESHPNMTVIYKNQPYTVYMRRSEDTMTMIGECVGVDPDLLNEIDQAIPREGRPIISSRYYSGVFIPQPHKQDCWMLTDDDAVYTRGFLDRKYGVGWETAVFHYVQEGDTLSSIARQYGYLTSMIAAENHLEAPYVIRPYTKLRMPSFPSFYDIGKAGLYIGSVGVGFAAIVLYRMRRRRTASKKKNDQ